MPWHSLTGTACNHVILLTVWSWFLTPNLPSSPTTCWSTGPTIWPKSLAARKALLQNALSCGVGSRQWPGSYVALVLGSSHPLPCLRETVGCWAHREVRQGHGGGVSVPGYEGSIVLKTGPSPGLPPSCVAVMHNDLAPAQSQLSASLVAARFQGD